MAHLNKPLISLKTRLALTTFLFILAIGTIVGALFHIFLEKYFTENLAKELTSHIDLISQYLTSTKYANKELNISWLSRQIINQPELRITIISEDGTVLAETHHDHKTMENHLTRPEVQTALKGATGYRVQKSGILGIPYMYVAKSIKTDNTTAIEYQLSNIQKQVIVIRAALPVTKVDELLSKLRLASAVTIFLFCLLAVTGSRIIAEYITKPIKVLTGFTDRLSKGEWQLPPLHTGILELDYLSLRFKQMAKRLENEYEAIEGEKHKLRIILGEMKEGIIITDETDKVIIVNNQAETIFNCNQNDILDKKAGEFYAGFELATILEILQDNKEMRRTFTMLPIKQTYELTTFPVKNREGAIAAKVAVLHNITEREKLDDIRKDFVANASHELRTPIATIQATVEALLSGGGNDAAFRHKFLNRLEEETKKITDLIKDLLDLSKAEQSALDNYIQKPIIQIIKEVSHEFREPLEKKEIKLLQNFSLNDKSTAKISYSDFRTIFRNLLDNAIKHSPDNTTIIIEAVAVNECEIRISIKDAGQGIPKDQYDRIFERFYRIEREKSSTKTIAYGTGLGLSIVKHLVERSGGKIWVESQVGSGSTFYFTLPLSNQPA